MSAQPQAKGWTDRFLKVTNDFEVSKAGETARKLSNALKKIPDNAPEREQAVQKAFGFWVEQLRHTAEHGQKDNSGSEMSTLNEAALTVLKALKPDEQNACAPALLDVWHDALEDHKIHPPRAQRKRLPTYSKPFIIRTAHSM